MADLLFELGVEEIPAHAVGAIRDQLKDLFQARLAKLNLGHGGIECAASNRRLMVHVTRLSEKTANKEETILGPAKRIALDDRGAPTVALKKFCEINRVKLADVVEIETAKGSYLGIVRIAVGEDTGRLLQAAIPEILAGLTFAKTMVWNESRVPFIRPIRNILAMFNNQPLAVEFAGIRSGNKALGHLLLSDAFFEVNSFKDYVQGLSKNFIILKEEERKAKILAEIKDIETDLDGRVRVDEGMLDYYVFSNEYPVAFSGSFDAKYLSLPAEIIATFMTHEKKLLPVTDRAGKLSNFFVGVANIPDENKKVSRGNEKVIKATFEDAQFFWDMDRKVDFFSLKPLLKNVMFQKELGTYLDKVGRMAALVDFLVNETHNGALREKLQKAAFHCKNDLLTKMVREFPSLQGIMGGLYLKEAGEDAAVWKAIYDHYLPRGLVDEKLDDLGAGILSIADRIDNIAGFVGKGIKISSSKDPYGIRRDANAIIKIIVDFKLAIDLDPLIRLAVLNFAKKDADLQRDCDTIGELFISRLENSLKDYWHFRYDIVNAVLGKDTLSVYDNFLKAEALSKLAAGGLVDQLAAVQRRLKNIGKGLERCPFSEGLLKDREEKILSDVFKESKPRIDALIIKKNFLQASSEILEMKPIVDRFFDKILVMDANESIRKNRIALLQRIDELLSSVADFSLLVELKPGEKI
ncbi:MAG: glycine--tRNA ligase subunit beta [Candidatus Aminicenantes bacterium]|nr:glycine--tRNA ligase subunit beta [Candidatus Aminicenantes bacterium]